MNDADSLRRQRPGVFYLLLAGLVLVLLAWVVRGLYTSEERLPPPNSLAGLLQRLALDEDTAHEAQLALEKRPEARDLTFWRRILESPSPRARYLAADTIAKRKTPEAAQVLAGLMRDNASEVRIRAVETLVRVDREAALPTLLAALRDGDTWVREKAATQLRFLQDKRAVPMLMVALRDPERSVSFQVMTNLRKLTGQHFRARYRDRPDKFEAVIRQWEQWWQSARPQWKVDPAYQNVQPVHPSRKDPAPGFQISSVQGRRIQLADLKGKLVLLNFWGTWCGFCQAEVQALQRVKEKYGPRGLEIIGLGVAEKDADSVRKYAREHGLTYTLALATPNVLKAYGYIEDVPVTVLIDRQGNIRYRWEGDRDEATFSSAVERLLAEP
ncbi:MAG TPA: redoxin domain-containing protein [Chthonomonadales bacterium]|nr:redoxin domain-containing protein [Chthonomonadales bacterium]